MIRLLAGVGLVLAALLSGFFLEGGEILLLVRLSPFLITTFVPLFAALAVWPFSAVATAWKDALVGPAVARERSIAIWRFTEIAVYITTVAGSLTGGVLILNHWERPLTNLPFAFGVALVGPLYAVVYGLVFRILRARVAAKS